MPKKKAQKKQDPIAVEMGRRLRREREAVGMSQAQLSAAMKKVDPKAPGDTGIGNYETGSRRLRHEKARLLERILGKPAGYFLCELSEEEADVIVAMRKAKNKI